MIGYYNYTVILTYGGLISAVVGILLAAQSQSLAAVCCLLFSGLCDMFDGTIANMRERTRAERRFGVQIDSPCDLVGFGILPVMIGWASGMEQWTYYLVSAVYVLCGVIRLAYYNVTEEERQDATDGKRESYLGLPISGAALILAAVYCIIQATACSPVLYAVFLLVTGVAFVLPFTMPKPGYKTMAIFLLLGLGMLTYLLFLA